MGTYTPVFQLYKPDDAEIVDCDPQLNRNLNILDAYLKVLMEWPYTTAQISGNLQPVASEGYRLYSSYDDVPRMIDENRFFQESATTKRPPWVNASSYLVNGWIPQNNGIWYRHVVDSPNPQNSIEWSGSIKRPGLLDDTTSQTCMTLPVGHIAIPDKLSYFLCSSQDAPVDYSIIMAQVNPNRNINVWRFGNTPSDTSNTYADFDGIRYDRNVI